MRNLPFRFEIQKAGDAAMTENPTYEIARLLRQVAERVENDFEKGELYDTNGNRIGSWLLDLSHTAE